MPTQDSLPDPLLDKLRIAEYELRERVEQHVLGRLKNLGTLLGVVVAIVGFVGFGFILDYVSSQVTDTIKKDIERDTDFLRDRVNKDLAEIGVKAEFLRAQAEAMRVELELFQARSEELTRLAVSSQQLFSSLQNDSARLRKLGGELETGLQALDSHRATVGARLNELRAELSQLDALGSQYQDLQKRVQAIGDDTKAAAAGLRVLDTKTEQLQTAVSESTRGKAAIFQVQLDFEGAEEGLFRTATIGGANFGDISGEVFLRLGVPTEVYELATGAPHPVAIAEEVELQLDPVGIEQWSSTAILIRLSDAQQERYLERLRTARPNDHPSSWRSRFGLKVRTASGEETSWAAASAPSRPFNIRRVDHR